MNSIIGRIRNLQFNSRLARGILGLVYREGNSYRVPFGPIRGARVRYHPAINFHVMLGLWELQNVRFLARVFRSGLVRPDSIVCDVGANVGMFSLWLGRTVPQGRVYAFEAAPVTQERLRDNLKLNRVANVEVIAAACADRTGPVEFFIGHHHHSHSLNAEWSGSGMVKPEKLVVPGVTLDDFFAQRPSESPAFVKMDIEGGGVFALKGCRQCCEKARPVFLIESHTPDEDRAISDLVVNCKYAAFRVENNTWITHPERIHPDPDGIWGTVFLCPLEKRETVSQILGVRA